MRTLGTLLVLLATLSTLAQDRSPDGVWTWSAAAHAFMGLDAESEEEVRTLDFAADALRSQLSDAPLESTDARRATVALPLQERGKPGRFVVFEVERSPLVSPAMAERYSITSYRGRAVDDPTMTTRFNVTAAGLRGVILTPRETYFITPFSALGGVGSKHLHFNSRTVSEVTDDRPVCQVRQSAARRSPRGAARRERSSTTARRRYRLAVAATGEYTQFHHGLNPTPDPKDAAQLAIIDTIEIVRAIYERELGIELELVDNRDLIQTDPENDGYDNFDADQLLAKNQEVLDTKLTTKGYDVGHVFSTGGGGKAAVGCVCDPQRKARGETGLDEPTATPEFAVDFVAHELGHQFGADHTFNGTKGNCKKNRVAENAFEPGSGTTIMAYAGICDVQNLAEQSDDYFHAASLDQISEYVSAEGASCAKTSATSNRPPAVTGPARFSVPAKTPFALTVTGSDADGDALTYTWEEYYTTSFAPPWTPEEAPPDDDTDGRMRPIVRSFRTDREPAFRYTPGPKLQFLPQAPRALNIRTTARDQKGGFGSHDTRLDIVKNSGPFEVKRPKKNAAVPASKALEIAWNVGRTNVAPISATDVRLLLSTDGGATFPHVLSASTANDGSESVALPANLSAANARVRVEAIGNVFFASSESFSIGTTAARRALPQIDEDGGDPTPLAQTLGDMRSIGIAVESWAVDHDRYPASIDEELEKLVRRPLPRTDAWGTALRYLVSDDAQRYAIVSAGEDRRFETAGRYEEKLLRATGDLVFMNGAFAGPMLKE